jgi:hypothetical protein
MLGPRLGVLFSLLLCVCTAAAEAAGLPAAAVSGMRLLPFGSFLSEKPESGSFPLVRSGKAAPLFVSKDDEKSVARAASDLQADIERVTTIRPQLSASTPSGAAVVIVGTVGKSTLIDGLIKSGKLDAAAISGKWESYLIATVANPLPGVAQALVIAGSDRRGTIYGIYEVSEQIGVSPWYWWADVPVRHRDALSVLSGRYVQGPPAVKYRGIFINDEAPALAGWAHEKFGGFNAKMYAHVFELILRLRGNYLWPAMWGNAFNEDDPENPRLADEYGIVMGTSHHEPMMRAQKEWTKRKASYGNGQWNYATNKDALQTFWREGIARNKNYDNLVTMGMRGDGDMSMASTGSFESDKALLENIIVDQRRILGDELHKDPAKVPQLWALFTEVLKYYDAGMKVPDDVTLLFTDDNVGNIRRLPTAAEAKRTGGAGIYFHMDMHGGPFSYQWLNSNPLPKIWEQMNLAYRHGADRIWIANIGDIKPLEVPIEYFIRLGWDPDALGKDRIADWSTAWAKREFGPEHAAAIADIVAKYAKYNGWRKPDILNPGTYSIQNYREAERVLAAWNDLADRAETIGKTLPPEAQDAYYELVLHPVKACANLTDMYISAGRNKLFAAQGRAAANAEAARVRELFSKDQALSDYFNRTLAGGKWSHMMDQTHIGMKSWDPPPKNIMPDVSEFTLSNDGAFGVSLGNKADYWPNDRALELGPLDSLSKQRGFFEVYPTGSRAPQFTVTADRPWIVLGEGKAFSSGGDDRRYWVDIDWTKLPPGTATGYITVKGIQVVKVKVTALKAAPDEEAQAKDAFGGLIGPIAVAAADASRIVPVGSVRWEAIPDYGRLGAAMEVFPVTAPHVTRPSNSPRLEYDVFLPRPGNYLVDIVTGPTLDAIAGNYLGLAVGLDKQMPQVKYVFTEQTHKDETFLGRTFYENARNNARTMHFSVDADTVGRHVLRLFMIDPAIVVQKIIVHDGILLPSYFGPPEVKKP